jgi:hypothetical protein
MHPVLCHASVRIGWFQAKVLMSILNYLALYLDQKPRMENIGNHLCSFKATNYINFNKLRLLYPNISPTVKNASAISSADFNTR